MLARHLLGWDRAAWVLHADDPAPPWFAARYDNCVARRASREPVAYITGVREFWGRDFEVSSAVLVPRPETELIVQEALAAFAQRGSPARIVDVGTGCGCLAISLSLEWPHALAVMTDVSEAALQVAVRNARRHCVSERVRAVRGSLLESIRGEFDLIVANPPYVPDGARAALSPDVRDHEPSVALFGGRDGLGLVRVLLQQVASRLTGGGILLMEFGAGQDDAVEAAVAEVPGLRLVRIVSDLQGIPRVASLRRTV